MKNPTCQHCQVRFKSVFCDLPPEEINTLSISKGCNIFPKGQTVFYEGAFPHGLFCINSGKVKISQLGPEGKEQIVRLCKEGDILGYCALLSGDKYSCSATAIDESSICFIPRNVLINIMERNTNLSKTMLKLLAFDLKKAEHKITNIAQVPVRERLAEALLFLKETYGFENDESTLNVILSREEIANIVGTATETVIRLLSEFRQDKIIELTGKKIKILNLRQLVKVANIFD